MKSRLKLRTVLLLSFAALTVLSLLIGSAGFYGAVRNEKAMNEVGTRRLQSLDNLLLTNADLRSFRGIIGMLSRPEITGEERQRLYGEIAALRQHYMGTLKAYQAVPKTTEEAALAENFQKALTTWREENSKVIEYSKRFEANGVVDPHAVVARIEQFTKDHHIAVGKVMQLLRSSEATFQGADDPTACNLGKWMPTFSSDNADLMKSVQGMNEPHQRFHAAVGRIKQRVAEGKTDEAARVFDEEMRPAMEEVFRHFAEMQKPIAVGLELEEAMSEQAQGPAKIAQEAAMAVLDKLVQMNRDGAAATVRDSTQEGLFLKRFNLGTMIAGAIFAAGLGYFVTRWITRPIQRISSTLSAGADQTTASAEQVASASQELAAGSSEQAAAVEETGSSLEELSSMTKNNEENAHRANELAKNAWEAAQKGAEGMRGLAVAMQAIRSSSDEVAKILKTIDELAFQTNILALNAAVEAARAGEAGMGFAVVADEVRALAHRSAQAARDTATKIEAALSNTTQGVQISADVDRALAEIVARTEEVNKLIAEVARASHEQSQGIVQINSAVSQMDKVVQSNAAGAEESAAAARELSQQAITVKESVAELMQMVGWSRSEPATHRDNTGPGDDTRTGDANPESGDGGERSLEPRTQD